MILVNEKYDLKIEMRENRSCCLVVEKPEYLADMMMDLIAQSQGDEGGFVLSDHGSLLPIKHYLDLQTDIFHLDLNQRKVMKGIYAALEEVAQEEVEAKGEITTAIISVLERVTSRAAYDNLTFDFDFEWENLFKFFHLRIEEQSLSLEEKLAEYFKILSLVLRKPILCLLHAHIYFSEKQIRELIQLSKYQKLQLLFIEAREPKKIPDEDIYILDQDRCVIIK
ncbi:type II-A CRISPR-associated protein Csn2 [Pseudoramibacter alactolyticus]|uniref:type II-A CRISPR-associated protein Csn2 n=1 Tax=Pseudoramibacter alactolyticus TaxID=113287 RepID=UPI00248E39A7|nr:type II-A CRISPR-associated protein Csn2 [Pseudoramibacter alactolyticus]